MLKSWMCFCKIAALLSKLLDVEVREGAEEEECRVTRSIMPGAFQVSRVKSLIRIVSQVIAVGIEPLRHYVYWPQPNAFCRFLKVWGQCKLASEPSLCISFTSISKACFFRSIWGTAYSVYLSIPSHWPELMWYWGYESSSALNVGNLALLYECISELTNSHAKWGWSCTRYTHNTENYVFIIGYCPHGIYFSEVGTCFSADDCKRWPWFRLDSAFN